MHVTCRCCAHGGDPGVGAVQVEIGGIEFCSRAPSTTSELSMAPKGSCDTRSVICSMIIIPVIYHTVSGRFFNYFRDIFNVSPASAQC